MPSILCIPQRIQSCSAPDGPLPATTSHKQLNFVQHIKTLLKQHGLAAVVLPDLSLPTGITPGGFTSNTLATPRYVTGSGL